MLNPLILQSCYVKNINNKKHTTDSELTNLTLAEAAEGIAVRRFTSLELTKECINRIKSLGSLLNCIARFDEEAAIETAIKADSKITKGYSIGPLHGIPLAHKDIFFRKNHITAAGSHILSQFVPEVTATALNRLDHAGALDIARLQMMEFALGFTGHNKITGTPLNPWNHKHIPGGSSSGSASALAARIVFGSLGSDTGGSVRLPAACCGLFGLKPTYDRISRFGLLPLSFSLDHVGIMTRSALDAAIILDIVAGEDKTDSMTENTFIPKYQPSILSGIKGVRIGVPKNYFFNHISMEIESLMRDGLYVFKSLGAIHVDVEIPESFGKVNGLSSLVVTSEAATFHRHWIQKCPEKYGSQTLSRILPGLMYPATQYIEALKLRKRILSEFLDAVFRHVDVLYVPVIPVEVPTLAETDAAANSEAGTREVELGNFTRPFNYLGVPAMSVPAGLTANGLPNGFQLIGRPFDEEILLRAAYAYEQATNCSRCPPTYLKNTDDVTLSFSKKGALD